MSYDNVTLGDHNTIVFIKDWWMYTVMNCINKIKY